VRNLCGETNLKMATRKNKKEMERKEIGCGSWSWKKLAQDRGMSGADSEDHDADSQRLTQSLCL
jgi:hypothetical protein